MRIPEPIFPNEHGAWVVLMVPMLVTVAITERVTANALLFIVSATALFMSHAPVHTLLKQLFVRVPTREKLEQARLWASAYLGVSAAVAVPLFLQELLLLIPFAMLALGIFFGHFAQTRRHPKAIPGDLIAVVGLTLGSPALYYVLRGTLDRTAATLWILNLLFFGSTVFYVHMKMKAASLRKNELSTGEKLFIGRDTLIYHLVSLGIVAYLTAENHTTALVILAFVPMTAHAVYGTAKLSSDVRFKNLGFLLLLQSVLFGILVGTQMGSL